MASFEYTEIKDITALKDHVIVRDMNFAGRKLSSGILLLSDDLKTSGIRPRWAQVYRVGPEQTDVAPDQWVLIEHGRWTRGAKISIEGEEITERLEGLEARVWLHEYDHCQGICFTDRVGKLSINMAKRRQAKKLKRNIK